MLYMNGIIRSKLIVGGCDHYDYCYTKYNTNTLVNVCAVCKDLFANE